MANSIIRIKRSDVAGNPSTLASGELAYSAADANAVAGGDRLYIGFGSETNGNAANHFVVGGKFFTDMLDHNKGTLTADSAVLVDANKKINEFFVDDLGFDGSVISTTTDNTNLFITPDGTGKTVVSNLFIDDTNTSIEDFVIATAQGNIEVEGTTNEIDVAEAIAGDVQTYTVSLSDIFTPNTFGSSTEVPVITIDSKGRVTTVTTETISTEIDIAGETGSESVSLLDDTIRFNTGAEAGISFDVSRSGNDVFATVSLDQDLSTSGSPTFDDLTLSGDLGVNGGNITTTQTTATLFNDTVDNLSIGNDASTVSIGSTVGSTTINNDAIVAGDLTVQGTLTSLETVNLQTEDPLVKFGAGNPADAFSIGFYGQYNDGENDLKTGLFRDHVSKEYFLFRDLDADIQDNDIEASGLTLADLNLESLGVESTTDSSSTVTGAVVVAGGVGVAKTVHVGDDLVGSGAETSNLEGFNIDGGTY